MKPGIIIALLVCGAQPLLAQESSNKSTLPAASLTDVSWLVGDWEGRDTNGDRVIERWLPPIGGVMVGTFVQTARDPQGKVVLDWTEHMQLREKNGTLVLNSVTIQSGAETEVPFAGEKPLVSAGPCTIKFENLLIECSNKADPGSGLIVTYGEDFLKDGTGVYTIKYERAGND